MIRNELTKSERERSRGRRVSENWAPLLKLPDISPRSRLPNFGAFGNTLGFSITALGSFCSIFMASGARQVANSFPI